MPVFGLGYNVGVEWIGVYLEYGVAGGLETVAAAVTELDIVRVSIGMCTGEGRRGGTFTGQGRMFLEFIGLRIGDT